MRISDWSSDVCSSDLLAALLERPWTASPDAATWTALAALGLVSTAFAYILYFRILATAGATNVLLVTFLVPITALLLGTLTSASASPSWRWPAWRRFSEGSPSSTAGCRAAFGRRWGPAPGRRIGSASGRDRWCRYG